MRDDRPRLRRHQRERARNDVVERERTEASAEHEQAQRPAAAGETLLGWGDRLDIGTQRIADPFDSRIASLAEHAGESGEHAIRAVLQHAIGEAGARVEVVDDERQVACNTHQCARKRRESAESDDDTRLLARDDLRRLTAGIRDRVRAEQQALPALAAHAGKPDPFEVDFVLRDEPRFHAVVRAEPEHARAARLELGGDGEPGKM